MYFDVKTSYVLHVNIDLLIISDSQPVILQCIGIVNYINFVVLIFGHMVRIGKLETCEDAKYMYTQSMVLNKQSFYMHVDVYTKGQGCITLIVSYRAYCTITVKGRPDLLETIYWRLKSAHQLTLSR